MVRCPECPCVNRCLPADGPPGEVLFIGEAPGPDENKTGRVFVGKTGREVNENYLFLAGLRRDSCRFINAIACMPDTPKGKLDSSKSSHLDLLESCATAHLRPEIQGNARLRLLVPMGAFACRAVDPAIDLEHQHGIPIMTRWGIPALPMRHPARGIHEPKKMLEISNDWRTLKLYLRGQYRQPVDEYPEVDYEEITEPKSLAFLDPTRPLACDTEHSRRLGPYCLTISQDPGTGRLIRASNTRVLARLQAILDRWEGELLWHNWLYDAQPVGELGLVFPPTLIRDTMVMVYHLGNLPQGLKALAYRLLGMTMQDFDDLVRPYSTERVLEYYARASTFTWAKPDPEMVWDFKTNLWGVYKPQSMNTKLKRFFTDFGKNPDKDVFKMWEDNWTEQQAMIEERCGPWPGLDIDHVPFEKTLHYACRDVDALIRLWPIIQHMRSRVGSVPQEQWAM